MSIIQEALKKAEAKETVRSTIVYGNIFKDVNTRSGKRSGMLQAVCAVAFLALLSIFIVRQFAMLQPKTKTTRPNVSVVKIAPMAHLAKAPKKDIPLVAEAYHAPTDMPVVMQESVKSFTPATSLSIPEKPAPLEANFNLSGIMQVGSGLRAIVNNKVVVEGDEVEDAVVTAITKTYVVLKSGGQEISLRLK